ncbi:protein hunchback-like [Teleopsis dalmanni]|uniref:protein hunchback-like n=1 Tax=Teleopsis dalmanni TaxID=139649 RepID=UPI0018CD37AF|nr:protein hunchback-like [Teleopsis dalmanni]XP_037949672.1 protein hunchback-like [Teleopsis dalmanni]
MQNWDAMQPTANYDQHNTWYNNMFAANIKNEPGTISPTQLQHAASLSSSTLSTATSQLENYLKQQQQLVPMDTMSAMTPSPSNNDSMQHFFDGNIQQQLLQQQQYQQQFQQAQQAAAQNQVTSNHLPLGFNPLTPPGLPNAVLPPMSHFYNHNNMHTGVNKTPSPQPTPQANVAAIPLESSEKLQSALTPRNTPPMDITPPKSPKTTNNSNQSEQQGDGQAIEKDQDLVSNSSEDMKYAVDSDDDEAIRLPIYNSHGKMKNYKCKTCGLVSITKVAFWEHTRSHMKPDKILQCPKCPFVTELKHHLEYHTRKHKNIKPFQCEKCSYTCVNKSMLNSHRKSHSSVYQYRCSDCDYATKYCHSFKLHLRKYDHKPGMVLDEEGVPNPSVVIDVYGTRRGPKTKSAGGLTKRERISAANLSKQQSNEIKMPTSQLSAALQGFSIPQQHQMPASPAKSTNSATSDISGLALGMNLQQQQQQQQAQANQSVNSQANTQHSLPNLLPPLATILQQNRNMAFFPYWNLNLQMLAAQQQAVVLAQLSPRMRETALQQLQNQQTGGNESAHEEDDDDFESKSIDSAMDLSQGTPGKEELQPVHDIAMNLKLQEEGSDTPMLSSNNASRRKGRVLKLDAVLQLKSASQSPEQMKESPISLITHENEERIVPSPFVNDAPSPLPVKVDEHISAGKSMETTAAPTAVASVPPLPPSATINTNSANTSSSSTASSSGNSSNSSSSLFSIALQAGAIYECKYCDIFFRDAVLYTIHMGYHSCDDVFKCNMCGDKCDGPVGLFVHMARNAHS